MARILVVGGGCRALGLARDLRADGHALRITTRDAGRLPAIEETGAEGFVGDPDRIGTLAYALENVTLVMWLLGTASGTPDKVAALHDTRWERMLEEVVDTTVRGVVYEAAGTVATDLLARGVEHTKTAHRENNVPYVVMEADPADDAAWRAAALSGVQRLLR